MVTPARINRTQDTEPDEEEGGPPPIVEGEHIPVFLTGDALPAPVGNVASALHGAGYAALRTQAEDFFTFLASPNPSLLKLNESRIPFVALVNIPKSNKVKVIFCPGFGSSPIGSAPASTDGKLLCLHGDGSSEWGPPQPLVFPVSGCDVHTVTTMDATEFSEAVTEKGNAFNYPLIPECRLSETCNIRKLAPIPAYFVYDGVQGDLHAGLVYERLLKHSAEDTAMIIHAKEFLLACLSGQIQRDPKPYMTGNIFSAPASNEARVWAHAIFKRCFPSLHPTPTPTPATSPNGLSPEVQALLAALLPTVTPTPSPAGSPSKPDETKTYMSEGELQSTLVMCGQASSGTLGDLPGWFQECAARGTSEQYQLTIIRKWLMTASFFDDADVPLTATLLKTIRKRAWTGKEGNISRPSLVNALDGISPFAMLDMDEDAVANFNDEDALLDAASLVSVADLRSLRQRLKAVVPVEAEDFLLLLKRFGNLLFALFSEHSPLFKCMREIIRAYRGYSREARKQLGMASKGAILWIILLQARQFALGEVNILFEFTKMHEDLRAKKSVFHHSEMPRELLGSMPPSPTPLRNPDESAKRPRLANPSSWHPQLKDLLLPAVRVARNPTFTQLLGFLKRDAYHIFPRGSDVCVPNSILGTCQQGDKCKRKHRLPNDEQVKNIMEFVQPFVKHPEGLREGKSLKV